jgi:hypothetical protein
VLLHAEIFHSTSDFEVLDKKCYRPGVGIYQAARIYLPCINVMTNFLLPKWGELHEVFHGACISVFTRGVERALLIFLDKRLGPQDLGSVRIPVKATT